jgi:hypothetical protein
MFALIHNLPDNVVGVRAIGAIEDDDYEELLVPTIEDRLTRHDKIRLLYVLGAEYTGYDDDAKWQDAKLGMKTFNSYDRMAIVSDIESVRRSVRAFGWLIPGDIRVFPVDDLVDAEAWIIG